MGGEIDGKGSVSTLAFAGVAFRVGFLQVGDGELGVVLQGVEVLVAGHLFHVPQVRAAADVVVCWENDWEARGGNFRGIEILSLKEHAGAEPRVFLVGCRECNFDELKSARLEWNVPKSSQKGDLLLMYRSAPISAICDIWRVEGGHQRFSVNNPAGRWLGIQANIRRLAVLENPVTYAHLSSHPSTRRLTIVQMKFRGKSDITLEWTPLSDRIVAANPATRRLLSDYSPD